MRKFILFICFISLTTFVHAQLGVRYDPSKQPKTSMQYFKPTGELFVGDAIPFFHEGTYYLYWLLDSAHHAALNGLGGHQWTVSTTKDLINWKHYPIAIGIDEEWEKSICTGSVAYANKKFYAFYATRSVGSEGKVEQLSYAISDDGFVFKKQKPNPFYLSAPGYSKKDFRDPKVIVDSENVFHLLVSSKQDSAVLKSADGALVHLTSKDLKKWEVKEPVLTGQGSVPECPDHFLWNGLYYLVYGHRGNTLYMKSKSPYGPWQEPSHQTLSEEFSNVAKTAEFVGGRRIAAAWIPSRRDNKDDGREIFGGNAVFRELIQHPDGTLGTKFPKELIPATGTPLKLNLVHDGMTTTPDAETYLISAPNGVGAGYFANIPANCRITLEIEPTGDNEEYGLYLRSNAKAAGGYKLSFSANNRAVTLANSTIQAVAGLNSRIKVDIIMKDDIVDVSIDDRRCIVNRLPEQKGNILWLFAKHGKVRFKLIGVAPLL